MVLNFNKNHYTMSDLKEDLKTKYLEQRKKADIALEEFSCSLQNMYHEHRKLLNENIELFITSQKLKKIVDDANPNQQVSVVIESLPLDNVKANQNQIELATKPCSSPQSSPILSTRKKRKVVKKIKKSFNNDIDNNPNNSFEKDFTDKAMITTKNNDIQRSICDETYFTQAEMEHNDTDMTHFEFDVIDDDETQFEMLPKK